MTQDNQTSEAWVEAAIKEVNGRFPVWKPTPSMFGYARAVARAALAATPPPPDEAREGLIERLRASAQRPAIETGGLNDLLRLAADTLASSPVGGRGSGSTASGSHGATPRRLFAGFRMGRRNRRPRTSSQGAGEMSKPANLRPMSDAPTSKSVWVALWYQAKPEFDGNIFPVAAHYACGGGEDQPRFNGWFRWSGGSGGFYEAPADPIGWTPIEGVSSPSPPARGEADVMQIDRDGAASLAESLGMHPRLVERIRSGKGDDGVMVQAITKARQTARAEALGEAASVVRKYRDNSGIDSVTHRILSEQIAAILALSQEKQS